MPKRARSKSANAREYKKPFRPSTYPMLSSNRSVQPVYNGGVPRPLGRRVKAEHSYAVVNIAINPGAAGLAQSWVFSANGMYDPDITGVGQQPVGFDNMTALFDHYTVIYSKIRVDYYSTDTTYSAVCGVLLKDNATTSNNVMNLLCGESVSVTVNPQQPMNQVVKGCNVSKFLGRPAIMSEDDLRGTSTTNPTEQAYYHVFVQPNTTADIAEVTCVVRIDYVAIWTEPRSLSNS